MFNAQRKGKQYERDIGKLLSKAFKYDVKRVPMSGAIHDFISSDLYAWKGILKDFHIECKRQEKLNFWKAFEKTKYLAKMKTPLVIATKNNYISNIAVMDLEDLINLLIELEGYRDKVITHNG